MPCTSIGLVFERIARSHGECNKKYLSCTVDRCKVKFLVYFLGCCSFVIDVCCSDGKEFCVATTHLLYNPKAGEVKLAQMSYLFAELHRMATIPGTYYNTAVHVLTVCRNHHSQPSQKIIIVNNSSVLNPFIYFVCIIAVP